MDRRDKTNRPKDIDVESDLTKVDLALIDTAKKHARTDFREHPEKLKFTDYDVKEAKHFLGRQGYAQDQKLSTAEYDFLRAQGEVFKIVQKPPYRECLIFKGRLLGKVAFVKPYAKEGESDVEKFPSILIRSLSNLKL